MNATQKRIEEALKGARSATAAELAQALGMTVHNIRHHLAILEQAQVVEKADQPALPGPGRGRPAYVYRLRPQGMQNNLDALCRALLDECLGNLPDSERSQFIQHVATRLVADRAPGTGHLGIKLSQAVQALNPMHYQARWEAHARAPRIFFHACPYLAILPDHPELCRMDAHILSTLTGLPVFQAARIDQAHYCLFYIGKPDNP